MQVAGPGVGGLAVQVLGGALALVLDVVSFLVSAVCLWRVDPRSLRPREPTPRARPRCAARSPRACASCAATGYLRFFSAPGSRVELRPHRLRRAARALPRARPRVAPATVGLLLSAGSVGGLVGAAVATRPRPPGGYRPGHALAAGARRARAPCSSPLAGPVPAVVLVPLGVALVGVGVVGANVVRSAFRQRYTPPRLLGRTMSASSVVNFGTMPLAGLVAGWLGTPVGVQPDDPRDDRPARRSCR